ncbi:hypothetical protein O181_117428 [Austropuccinia psidii MF-1]|uniref:Uncharacterized protein n=1 Tax=Austropuccinia psidii MF-1 TaxID=1389203 RepID=A0A9Q3PXG7_9BASI|nr:hypothetical protein [Austropuccinia psidii MF-1]
MAKAKSGLKPPTRQARDPITDQKGVGFKIFASGCQDTVSSPPLCNGYFTFTNCKLEANNFLHHIQTFDVKSSTQRVFKARHQVCGIGSDPPHHQYLSKWQ